MVEKNNDVWERRAEFPPEILRIYRRFKDIDLDSFEFEFEIFFI